MQRLVEHDRDRGNGAQYPHTGIRLVFPPSARHLEIVGTWELLLTFPDGRSAAFECSKRNGDCRATCRAIAGGAAELTRNLSRPRSLDFDFTDWDPEGMSTWDDRIVMVADDEAFLEWQRDWLGDTGR